MKNLAFLLLMVFFAACEKPELQEKEYNLKKFDTDNQLLASYELLDIEVNCFQAGDKWKTDILLTGENITCKFTLLSNHHVTSTDGDYVLSNEKDQLLSNILIISGSVIADESAVFSISYYEGVYYVNFMVYNNGIYFECEFVK